MLRLTRRHLFIGLWAGFLCLAGPVPDVALAQDDEPVVVQEGSWLERTLKRFFGGRAQEGEDLDGLANQMVDRYVDHIGKPIEVVIVHQVDTFDDGWDQDKGSSTRLFNRLSGRVQSYTRDSLIREYLLFKQGDKVDPFLLADSERMLRNLEFINDVRIILVPLAGEIESVAVVVETRDRWPFGVSGTFKDVDRYEAGLFLSNLGGQGIRFDNKILYRRDFEPEIGYRGTLSKQNVAGSFVRVDLEYEDSWRELRRFAAINRDLVHPGIRWVGGATGQYTDNRNDGDVPSAYRQLDTWLGHAFRLDERPADQTAARKVLVPATRVLGRDWEDRPEVRADSNLFYHERTSYMGGLTYQYTKNYKTSFLFRMGELENIPSGLVLKLTGGYEDGEFHGRTFGFFDSAYFSVRHRGDIFGLRLGYGGYFRDHRFEDGLFNVWSTYISRLYGEGAYRHRFYSQLSYVLGINRVNAGGLMLANRTGLRELPDNTVRGDQRLLANLEYRMFTPWEWLGFHVMLFGFVDAGTMAGEEQPLFDNPIYASGGLGVRFDNPDLVLQTFQLRVAMLNTTEDDGVAFAFTAGNPTFMTMRIPTVQPGLVGYQ